MMMRNVMVPLDGSPFGEQALPAALALAGRARATVHLVHVHQRLAPPLLPEGLVAIPGDWETQHRAREQEYIEAQAAKVPDRGAAARGIVIEGGTADALERYARGHAIDLIVMTSHGRGGISRSWLGNVAGELLRGGAAPVLVIRAAETPDGVAHDLRRVLVPLDGSTLAEAAIEPAMRLAGGDAEVTLLQVLAPLYMMGAPYSEAGVFLDPEIQAAQEAHCRAYLDRIAGQISPRAASVQTVVRTHTHPAQVVRQLAGEIGADLIALATHGRGAVGRTLLGSVADKVIRTAELPVLVVRSGKPQRGQDTVDSSIAKASPGEAEVTIL
jgi:nucleotide-binding universal stress UspA family protein